jgi:hypothetical protein
MIGGVIVLAVVMGERMSGEAVAVVVGVVFGVAASIPTSLLVMVASRGRGRQERRYGDPAPPQVVILQSGVCGWEAGAGQVGRLGEMLGMPPEQLPRPPASYYTGEPARRYRVVGQDADLLEAEVSGGFPDSDW